MIRPLAVALIAAGSTLAATAQAQSPAYLDHAGLTRELRALVNANARSAKLTSLGTTLGNREIWVVEIANPGGKPVAERPGVLVVGNLEGDHLVGSSHALESVRYILANTTTPAVKKMLDSQVVYVFPRLNPDGAELSFAAVKSGRKGNARPFDDDNDGRMDEDGPEDLNGDGVISVMRVKDPAGEYMIDPADPRAMKRADVTKGEVGTHKLYWEGTDNDGDGFINEDAPGGVDLNRNFQHDYPYFTSEAGPHMVSEKESRALMDFMIAHRNIGAILTFGHSDNLVTPPDANGRLAAPVSLALPGFADASNANVFQTGVLANAPVPFGAQTRTRGAQPGADNNPASGRRPDTLVNRADLEYFRAVSEAYRTITGLRATAPQRRPRGAFFQYGYFQFGVPSFTATGWGTPVTQGNTSGAQGAPGGTAAGTTAGTGSASGDAALLKGYDAAGMTDAFVPWKSFRHAELGDVEIGGFRPYASVNPAAKELPELGRKHGEFVVRLASMLPRVRVARTEVKAHGGGLYTVIADIENTGFFPASTAHGVSSQSVKPTVVQIEVPSTDIVTGSPKAVRIPNLNGSNTRTRVTWVIRGKENASVAINLLSQKGGTDSASVTLK